VKPRHIVGFSTWPGEGCEAANFGFSRYPAIIQASTSSGRNRKVATKPGDTFQDRVLDSVREAVSKALDVAQDEGFSHDLEDEFSLVV